MNTKHFFRSLAMLFVTLMGWIMPQVVWAEYDGTPVRPTGEGTESDPYQIATAAHLYWFAALVNGDSKVCTGGIARNDKANAILTADIVVNDTTDWEKWGTDDFNDKDLIKWTPIGDGILYGGTFDGNNKTVSGLYFNDNTVNEVGLFGWNYGTIQNVGVEASYLKGGSSVGGVCGDNNSGTVSNCYNTGSVNGRERVGGVCGENFGTVSNCYNTGSVNGSERVGGVCGNGDAPGTVSNCYNTGSVNGSENQVGGVCGRNDGTVSNCHNTGSVNGSENQVGGVCGENFGTVSNCYNTGSVNGSERVGGVCGENFATVSNCYNTGSVNGSEFVGGVCGNGGGTVSNCHNTGSVNGSEFVGGVCSEFGYTNCYFLKQDGIGGDGEKDKDAFLSGEVAYLLSHPSDEDRIPNPWGQNIGTDTIPVFSDIAVYEYDTNCSGDKAYTNDSELNGATVEHDFTDHTLSDVADNNGLYSYVCKHNNAHLSNDKVIKDYDGANNLELKYDESGDYENNLYVEELNLADGTAFNVPVAFTAKKVSYDRIAAKDTMTIILPYDVPADKVNGSVYTLTNFDGKTLGYSISDGGIKANVPYLLYKQRNGETDQPMVEELKGVVIHSTEAIDTTKVNDGKAIQFGAYAKATYESGEESIEYDYYAYKNGKFTKAKKSITVSPFRAAVRLSKNASASSGVGTKSTRINANELNIVLEGADVVTGVDVQDNVAEFGGKVNVNDVLGRAVRLNVDVEGCLDGLKDGIYVVNGKKVIVKNK